VPLRYRIRSTPETVQDFELAAEEKYWEGVELLLIDRLGAGVYLLGYVAEMTLKNACALLDGATPFSPVTAYIRPTKNQVNRRFPLLAAESYHSLWFWAQALREKRRLAGRPLSFDSTFTQRVRRLYGIWVVDMRYKPDQTVPREAQAVYDDVTWLRDHRAKLVN
jgi:hypothetical protein